MLSTTLHCITSLLFRVLHTRQCQTPSLRFTRALCCHLHTIPRPSPPLPRLRSGTDQQDTWVLSSSDALIETEEMDNPYPDATAATFPDGNSPFWQTTYTWNFTHPPPLSSYVGAAAGGGLSGAGQAGTSATTATTLFLGVYAECDVGAGSDGGGDGNGRTRRLRRRSRRVAEVEVDGVGDGEGAGHNGGGDGVKSGDLAGSWALGIAPRVEFRYAVR